MKPRLTYSSRFRTWYCAGLDLIGKGRTPRLAYENWLYWKNAHAQYESPRFDMRPRR